MDGTKNEAQCSRKPYGLGGYTHLRENRQAWLEIVINSRKAIKFGLASWHFLISCIVSFLHFLIKACAPSSPLPVSHGPRHLGESSHQTPSPRSDCGKHCKQENSIYLWVQSKNRGETLWKLSSEIIPKGKIIVSTFV